MHIKNSSYPGLIDRNKFHFHHNESKIAFLFFVVYLFTVLIRPQDFIEEIIGFPLVMIAILLCFVFTLLGQRPLRWSPQQTLLILMLPFITVSAFLNGWGTHGLIESQEMLVSSILPLFLCATLISSAKRQRIVMFVTLFASILMVHNGWVQFNNTYGMGWTGTQAVGKEFERIIYVGIFSDPNDLGMLLVMNIPFLMYFYNKHSFIIKSICLFILLFFLYGVYMTGSRGTILGTAALIGFYFLLKYGGARLIIFSIVTGPVFATLLSQFGGLSSSEESARGRLYAWYDGIHYLLNNPIFGIGKGNFADVHGLTAHNSFILVASELGIVAYTFWGGALAITVYISYQFFKFPLENLSNHPEKENIIDEIKINNALFFSMIGFLVTAFFLSRSYVLLLFIFVGMVVASHLRLFKLLPEYAIFFKTSFALKCGVYSWVMILLVYVTLKVSL